MVISNDLVYIKSPKEKRVRFEQARYEIDDLISPLKKVETGEQSMTTDQ